VEKLPRKRRFVKRLSERKENYLAFLKYPLELRSFLSSTNVVEGGVNRKIEDMERACGGYFHSERDREFRYGLLARELMEGRWRRVNWKYRQVAHLLRHLFRERYEKDDF